MNKRCWFFGLLLSISFLHAYQRSWYLSESQVLDLLGGTGYVHVAYFSPRQGREIKELLVGLLAHEKKSVRCALFFLTNKHIIYALQQVVERGVSLQVIVSPESTKNGAVWTIPHIHVCVVSDGLMHHKFYIFDETVAGKSLLWTGSFNCTNQAVKHNRENIVVLEDERLIHLFKDEFDSLKQRSYPLFSQQLFDQLPAVAHNFATSKQYINREQLRSAVQRSLVQEHFVLAQPIADFLQERDAPFWEAGEQWWHSIVNWTQNTVRCLFI